MDATELLVCIKCRKGQDIPADDRRPGRALYDALAACALPEGVTLRAVDCLQNCDHGCSVALRGGNRWTYVFGNVDEASQADMLIEGAALYHATQDGLIPWRARPEHFKRNCVARIPPLTFSDPETTP
ncbi:DUF1636 family protein [Thetidibacter halocola]|uniref:DUF1636 domain-containing protein n=1 Tax=Thetidibacter halocola TaxID=2827239 RepID=A0A8J8B7X4_9RHOB|nr:DUF1636 domain-containing protein [Thetidibacter halocola]MBS0123990.1 DUF1636 domain-containing protein [Thetidibacter halocola]